MESSENYENISEKYFRGRLGIANKMADYIPGVGLVKLSTEAITGKTIDGKILTKAERLQNALITVGNGLAGALQAAGEPVAGLIAGSTAIKSAENIEYILQKAKEYSDKLKEKWQKV